MQTQYITIGPKAIDITNQRFGRLVALGPIARDKHQCIMWLCRCDCGSSAIIVGSSLRGNNQTKSCGCLHKEITSIMNRTHGMKKHPAYTSWRGMKERCLRPNHHKYPNYGGRGIKVYPAWIESFEAFYAHVSHLANCGEKGYSLDRIDNDGHYEPGNVRWATPFEQQRNTRHNLMLTYNGVTLCAEEWAQRIGMDAKLLCSRLARGWSIERALTTPVKMR